MSFLFVFALIATVTSSGQQINLQTNKSLSALIQSNSPCIWQISKTFEVIDTSNGKSPKIAFALEQECNDGYEIAFIDAEHVESITISKSVPIYISGLNKTTGKRMKFCGDSENDDQGQYIITVGSQSNGDIIIHNIEFGEWNGGFIRSEGGKSVMLQNSLLVGGGTIIHNTDGILDIQSDEFIGDGLNIPIDPFIFATKGNVNIINSLFKKGSFKGDRSGCIVCCGTVTECTIDSCQFTENKFNAGSAATLITTPSCTQMIIKGTPNKRTIFSGLNITNKISGHFIKTISSKVSISHTDFIDSAFSGQGNAITINEQQASEISFIWCNFTNLKSDSNSIASSCIHTYLSSENGFQFNAENCIFSDCRYCGSSQVLGNSITIQSEPSGRSAVRIIRFTECILINNRGNGYCGAVLIDSLTKCTINIIDSFFNENSGIEANDIWINSINTQIELNSSIFNTSYSDSLFPHIITINEEQQSIYNLNHFPGVIFVSNKTVSGTRDGSRSLPYQKILDSVAKLNYTSKPVNMPRTIYILDDIWDERDYFDSINKIFTVKSGIDDDDDNGMRRKPTWITTESQVSTIRIYSGDLTIEGIQFNFTLVSGSVRPQNQIIWMDIAINSLTIVSCIFNGLGINGKSTLDFIYGAAMRRMTLKDCIFQQANLQRSSVLFTTNKANTEFSAQNCIFKYANMISGDATLAIVRIIYTDGANFSATICGCIFDNCNMQQHAAILLYAYSSNGYTSKQTINNNKFLNCRGQQAGGIALGQYTTNIQIYNNEFINNSFINTADGSNDAYFDFWGMPTGWNQANFMDNVKSIFDGSTSDWTNSIAIYRPIRGYISITKNEYVYFINQISSYGNQSGTDEFNPLKTIQLTLQQSNRNSKLFFNLIGTQHNESIKINSNSVWKQIEIKSIQGSETIMRCNNDDENGVILTVTTDSITPIIVQYVKMIIDSGFFVIQQSNKAQLTLSHIEFIGAGTIKQEGLTLLLIEYSSFRLSNNISTMAPFVQAIRGQIEIDSCSFGTSLETNLGQPAIQTFAQCTNIKFAQTIFSNLHSIITNGEQKASGAVIEMGEKTEVEFTDCIFIHCIDSSSDIQHSTGAVCIILKSSDSLIHKLSDEQLIQSAISFNQCQFTGCIGGSSGAIQSISNSPEFNQRLNIIIDKCSFDSCGNDNSIVGACYFNGQSTNNNYGEASVTDSHFKNCIGIKSGGILFGENMISVNAKNNNFSHINIEQVKCLVATDIFFSSKELLDQSGGIASVTQGYKYEQDQQQNTIGQIKIQGFSSNFAQYLDCVSRNEEQQCGEIPCGGELNVQSDECEYNQDEDKDQECKQKCIPLVNTPITECGCLVVNDPRAICKQICIPKKDTQVNQYCPCFVIGDPRDACKTISIPTEDTPVTIDNPCLAHNDPREACKTISIPEANTPVTVDNPCLAHNDPREACKIINIPTEDTPVTIDNPCLAHNDPREACKIINIPTEDTPVTIDNPCLAHNDPREACKIINIPTEDTPVTIDNPCLAHNDPREACRTISIPTEESPITDQYPCLANNDPREACKTISIPTEESPITDQYPCLANNDPREACKTINIPTPDTLVTDQYPCLANNDPRAVCQKACIPLINTSIIECGCLEMNDPRPQCKKSCIPTANTPIDECCCFDIDDPRDECREKIQDGIQEEEILGKDEIKDEVAKKDGLSAGFIALIAIASVLAVIVVILIIIIIHLVRNKTYDRLREQRGRQGEEQYVSHPIENNHSNNNQQEDIIQEEQRFVLKDQTNNYKENYISEYDQEASQQQLNQQQNIKQYFPQQNISESNRKQNQQINTNSPSSSSRQQHQSQKQPITPNSFYNQDRPQSGISIQSNHSLSNSSRSHSAISTPLTPSTLISSSSSSNQYLVLLDYPPADSSSPNQQ